MVDMMFWMLGMF